MQLFRLTCCQEESSCKYQQLPDSDCEDNEWRPKLADPLLHLAGVGGNPSIGVHLQTYGKGETAVDFAVYPWELQI